MFSEMVFGGTASMLSLLRCCKGEKEEKGRGEEASDKRQATNGKDCDDPGKK